jgi:hypothetical protein
MFLFASWYAEIENASNPENSETTCVHSVKSMVCPRSFWRDRISRGVRSSYLSKPSLIVNLHTTVDMAISDDALFAAIEAKDLDKVRFLLEHGPNANARQTRIQKGLTARLVNGDWHDDEYPYTTTPIFIAIHPVQPIGIARLLLDHGADVKARTEYKETDLKAEPSLLTIQLRST